MRHSTYQALAPFYARRTRQLSPIVADPANREWMTDWFARRDELMTHVDELMTAGEFRRATAVLKANPCVRITEETVLRPVPPLVYPDSEVLEDDEPVF